MDRSHLLAFVLAAGCSAPGAESRPGGSSSEQEAYRITFFEVGRRLDGKIVSQRVFSATDGLFLAARIDADRPGQVLRVAWRPSGEDRAFQEDSIELASGENTVELALREHRLGAHRVDVSIDAEPVAQVVFEVRDGYTPSFTDEPASRADVTSLRRRPSPDADPSPEIAPEVGPGLLIVRCLLTREGTAESCVVLRPLKGANALALRWLGRQRWDPPLLGSIPVDAGYVFNFRFRPKGR